MKIHIDVKDSIRARFVSRSIPRNPRYFVYHARFHYDRKVKVVKPDYFKQ